MVTPKPNRFFPLDFRSWATCRGSSFLRFLALAVALLMEPGEDSKKRQSFYVLLLKTCWKHINTLLKDIKRIPLKLNREPRLMFKKTAQLCNYVNKVWNPEGNLNDKWLTAWFGSWQMIPGFWELQHVPCPRKVSEPLAPGGHGCSRTAWTLVWYVG